MIIEEKTKQWIKDRLWDSAFLIEFTKKDGTKREMKCTLAEGYAPSTPITQKKMRPVNEEVQVVWDMKKEDWRSFRWDSVFGKPLRFPLGNGEVAE